MRLYAITVNGKDASVFSQISATAPLLPPAPEDRPTGDPTGSVLGFALAARILEAHGGRIEERDGGLALVFPTG